MKILIVEDEKFARTQLVKMITSLEPNAQIVTTLESVVETVNFLKEASVDLIFLDIHLADDLSFKIFDKIKVEIPIIFTTAYDQYALQAFKVNSVDYLLKPIDEEELQIAIEKYKATKVPAGFDYQALVATMEKTSKHKFQERFLVSRGDKIMSTTVDQIAYFEGEDRYVYLVKKDGTRFIIDYKLSDLEELLDPKIFFRLNRSFIAHFEAIDKIITLSKSRLKVDLSPKTKREIFISAANNRSFKHWLNQ